MNEANANPEPEKLDLSSLDVAELKQRELLELFPEVRTEGGKIDFERLRAVLGEVVDAGRERYGMNWPGKAECMRTIQAPSMGTLLPMPDESVDWNTTENVIIEGDNLEVLKLLQKSYLGKIKMIYIDPPYNTGSDFVYPDNYTETLQTYLEYTRQADATGKRFGPNLETEGRFHSKWINMMFPRLYLSRQLLKEDGIMFISIDDGEYDNLRRIAVDVFGEENVVATIVWQKKTSPDARTVFTTAHDYILVLARNVETLRTAIKSLPFEEGRTSNYSNPDNDPRGDWASVDLTGQTGRAPKSQFYTIKAPDGREFPPPEGRCWALAEATFYELLADNRIWFGKDGTARPRLKKFLSEAEGVRPWTWWDNKKYGHNQEGSQELKNLFDGELPFDNPKPTRLLKHLVQIGTSKDGKDTVLDFFSGSGSLAEAVLQANKEDGGNRSFALVQLPEILEPGSNEFKAESVALKLGFTNIAQITRERVRRAASKLCEDKQMKLDSATLDTGFRAYQLGPSNFIPWDGTASNDAEQLAKQLNLGIDHTRGDRTPQDLLFEVLLKSWGEPALSLKVGEETIEGVRVFSIAEGAFLICLEEKVTLEFIRALAARKPDRVVMRESAFAGNDQLKTNAVQTFKSQGVTSFKVV